jgi:tetratricopeptide (TPR) repeat protein
MKIVSALLSFLLVLHVAHAQETSNDKLLAELSENSCKCIDSISTGNKAKDAISQEIKACINKQVVVWELGSKLSALEQTGSEGKKKKKKRKETITLDLGDDPNSKEFQKYYFELERYSVNNCPALKRIINVDDSGETNTFSKNPEAMKLYSAGVANLNSEKYDEAIANFKAALAIDSLFSFAWDNLGITCRRLERYPEALVAYQKSIAVNPSGKTPLQNIAVVYEYQKEYQKAIAAYERLEQIDKKDPEVYYGIGRIYAYKTHEFEKGLDNLCIAYNLYVQQGSPYRTDAEKVINFLFSEMKKEGNEKRFSEILKQHHIESN